MTDDSKTVGARLRKARKAAGLSTAVVAERMGMTPAAVRHHENGRNEPSLDQISSYTSIYKVTADWVLRGLGSGPGDPAGNVLSFWAEIPLELRGHAEEVLRTFIKQK